MTSPVPTRRREQADAAEAVRMLRAVHVSDGYPARWPADPRRWLYGDDQPAAWVAVHGDRLVGHIAIAVPSGELARVAGEANLGGPALVVTRLCVAPDMRGQRVGEHLLATAEDRIRHLQAHPLLEVTSTAVGALRLYRRRGWRCIAALDRPWVPPGATSLVMTTDPAVGQPSPSP